MNKAERHIVDYVEAKGYTIEYVPGYICYWQSDTLKIIYIVKNTAHGFYAAILHEYYHLRYYTKHRASYVIHRKNEKQKAWQEARAEEFVIRCFRQLELDMTQQQQFLINNWADDMPQCNNNDRYMQAYYLLCKKGLVR